MKDTKDTNETHVNRTYKSTVFPAVSVLHLEPVFGDDPGGEPVRDADGKDSGAGVSDLL